jgi:hypothetical protein
MHLIVLTEDDVRILIIVPNDGLVADIKTEFIRVLPFFSSLTVMESSPADMLIRNEQNALIADCYKISQVFSNNDLVKLSVGGNYKWNS